MNTANTLNSLVQEVQEHYGVGPKFTKSYLSSWAGSNHKDISTLNDIMALPPPFPMWFDFAMTTNHRGRGVAKMLKNNIPASARRFLDVGCGYGGFLVAFSKVGMEVIGIEIDPNQIAYAEENCLDHNLQDCVFLGDILDTNFIQQLGTFDVITCFDVIEHVSDADQALKNMVSLLNPGGILVLEIPNKNSINFVYKDGHFSLFGITLLNRSNAKVYYNTIYPTYKYDVGEYYELEYYKDRLDDLLCDLSLIESPFHYIQTLSLSYFIGRLFPSYLDYRRTIEMKLPRDLQMKMRKKFFRYLKDLGTDYLINRNKNGSKWFQEKYLIDFWTVLAKKQ